MVSRTLVTALVACVALLILRPIDGREQLSADDSITAGDLQRDVEFLASDDMRGRLVGTTENKRAAQYIEERFRRNGLRAIAGHGSYRQSFALVAPKLGDANLLRIHRDEQVETAAFARDFFPMGFSATGRATGPLERFS